MESDTESESFVQSFAEKDRSWTVVLKDIFDEWLLLFQGIFCDLLSFDSSTSLFGSLTTIKDSQFKVNFEPRPTVNKCPIVKFGVSKSYLFDTVQKLCEIFLSPPPPKKIEEFFANVFPPSQRSNARGVEWKGGGYESLKSVAPTGKIETRLDNKVQRARGRSPAKGIKRTIFAEYPNHNSNRN